MKKKILIAVDGSIHARDGLIYAADLLAHSRDVHFGLMHVQPIVSEYLSGEADKDEGINEALERVVEQNRSQSEEILGKSRQVLLSKGIDNAIIELISQPRLMGLTKDIIDYAYRNDYDAIVAGRRGLTRVQKVFMGSTSAKLIEYSSSVPAWIVDGEFHQKNFLVAVDVAAPWTHMLDHLSLMCEGLSDIRLTFYYVMRKNALEERHLGMDRSRERLSEKVEQLIESFWNETTQSLTASGLEKSQLELKTPHQTGKIGNMIMDEIASGDYGTVVLGRRGSDKAFYFGSVSRYVIERLTEHAIWVTTP